MQTISLSHPVTAPANPPRAGIIPYSTDFKAMTGSMRFRRGNMISVARKLQTKVNAAAIKKLRFRITLENIKLLPSIDSITQP